jgi:hypothetical protein
MSGSIRHSVAEEIAESCRFGDLNDSYGVLVSKGEANGKSFWSVTFCKAVNLDGEVRIYSPNFILIKWTTRYKHLPKNGSQKFSDVDSAKLFIQKNFVTI